MLTQLTFVSVFPSLIVNRKYTSNLLYSKYLHGKNILLKPVLNTDNVVSKIFICLHFKFTEILLYILFKSNTLIVLSFSTKSSILLGMTFMNYVLQDMRSY
jgi:hypothetical protein